MAASWGENDPRTSHRLVLLSGHILKTFVASTPAAQTMEQAYSGKYIFLTGATGFFGKERGVFCCPAGQSTWNI